MFTTHPKNIRSNVNQSTNDLTLLCLSHRLNQYIRWSYFLIYETIHILYSKQRSTLHLIIYTYMFKSQTQSIYSLVLLFNIRNYSYIIFQTTFNLSSKNIHSFVKVTNSINIFVRFTF